MHLASLLLAYLLVLFSAPVKYVLKYQMVLCNQASSDASAAAQSTLYNFLD